MGTRGRETQNMGNTGLTLLPPPERPAPYTGVGALEASRDTETGQEASRAAPVPGPTADRGAWAAMADRGAWVATADRGAWVAMTDRGAWAAMADQGIQEAMAGPLAKVDSASKSGFGHALSEPVPCALDHALRSLK